MPALPVYLMDGIVAIYGSGVASGMSGLRASTSGWKFGTVYQIGQMQQGTAVGSSVLFKEGDIKCRLVTQNNLTYTLVEEARLVLTERF
jgi:hypothetical protein